MAAANLKISLIFITCDHLFAKVMPIALVRVSIYAWSQDHLSREMPWGCIREAQVWWAWLINQPSLWQSGHLCIIPAHSITLGWLNGIRSRFSCWRIWISNGFRGCTWFDLRVIEVFWKLDGRISTFDSLKLLPRMSHGRKIELSGEKSLVESLLK